LALIHFAENSTGLQAGLGLSLAIGSKKRGIALFVACGVLLFELCMASRLLGSVELLVVQKVARIVASLLSKAPILLFI